MCSFYRFCKTFQFLKDHVSTVITLHLFTPKLGLFPYPLPCRDTTYTDSTVRIVPGSEGKQSSH